MYQNQHDVLGCVLQAKIMHKSTVRVSKSWNPRLHQYPAGTPPKAIPKNLAQVASTRYRDRRAGATTGMGTAEAEREAEYLQES